MFAKKFRLPASITFSQSKTIHSFSFSVKIQQNTLAYNRYGFVVSKNISKRAHIRNRTKRRFRACIEQLHKNLIIGSDMLFILKSTAVHVKSEVLQEEIKKVLIKEA